MVATRSNRRGPGRSLRRRFAKDLYGTQFYDSLLLAAGEATGCDLFLSEDLNDGQIYCGMKVVNPFKRKVV